MPIIPHLYLFFNFSLDSLQENFIGDLEVAFQLVYSQKLCFFLYLLAIKPANHLFLEEDILFTVSSALCGLLLQKAASGLNHLPLLVYCPPRPVMCSLQRVHTDLRVIPV